MAIVLRNWPHFDSVRDWKPTGGRPDGRGAMLTGPEFVVVDAPTVDTEPAQTRELIRTINRQNREHSRR